MGERKISSWGFNQGATKASRVWRPIVGDAEICRLRVRQVLVKGTWRRITIGNDILWSQFAKCNNEEKIINNDKPIEVGKSINTEDKSTRQVSMTNSSILTWPVDMSGDGQLTKEVDMMRSHILTTYVDMTWEGITINKVEDNNLLKVDDVTWNDDDFEIRSQIGTIS
jgi:hypothetical protein